MEDILTHPEVSALLPEHAVMAVELFLEEGRGVSIVSPYKVTDALSAEKTKQWFREVLWELREKVSYKNLFFVGISQRYLKEIKNPWKPWSEDQYITFLQEMHLQKFSFDNAPNKESFTYVSVELSVSSFDHLVMDHDIDVNHPEYFFDFDEYQKQGRKSSLTTILYIPLEHILGIVVYPKEMQ